MKTLFRFLTISYLLLSVIRCECEPQNVNVTLGDRFNRGGKSSLLKIGFISKTRCAHPSIELNFPNGESRTIKFDLIDIYLLKLFKFTQHAYYKRYVYLVEIFNLDDLSNFDYSIYRSNEDSNPRKFEYRSNILLKNNKNFIMFGDQPLDDLGKMVAEAIKSEEYYDGVMILGDLAYDLHDNWGIQGDKYFEMMEPITSRAPFFGITGNHDMIDGGDILNFRFRFPGSIKKHHNNFYNFVLENSLYIFMNPDRYLLVTNKLRTSIINKTRKIIQNFEDREERAFKFLFSHRPFNCVDYTGKESCSRFNGNIWDEIQKEIAKRNFDFHFCGHVHLYQRFNNHYFHSQDHILDNELDKETFDVNTVIIGTGGMEEDLLKFTANPSFNKRNDLIFIPNLRGFLRVKIEDRDKLRGEMIDVGGDSKKIVDKFIAISNYEKIKENNLI